MRRLIAKRIIASRINHEDARIPITIGSDSKVAPRRVPVLVARPSCFQRMGGMRRDRTVIDKKGVTGEHVTAEVQANYSAIVRNVMTHRMDDIVDVLMVFSRVRVGKARMRSSIRMAIGGNGCVISKTTALSRKGKANRVLSLTVSRTPENAHQQAHL